MTQRANSTQLFTRDQPRKVIELAVANFEQVLSGHPMIIVDFWAPWCGPCRGFSSVYERAAQTFPNVLFAKINVDMEAALADRFQIRSIPTLLFFRKRCPIHASVGVSTAERLENVIKSVLEQ